MGQLKRLCNMRKRAVAWILAVVIGVGGMMDAVPVYGSNVWPQKSTAPFYCLDGGKGWKAADRYEIYKYDTLPSSLTEVQAKRLFWAYPSNWNALKEAAEKYDPDLFAEIASTSSGPNVVKKVKDNSNSKFAWIADHPEIESRAIAVLEQMAAETAEKGKDAPEEIRNAISEEQAVSIRVPSFNSGPSALNTEFKLGSEFVSDIANIEAQSVWDNGSTGGSVGWVDASQEKNLVKAVMGDELYEITWSGDSIKIRNNGSAVANENAIGSSMSEEERYNKTTILYKITMRENSGWYTEGSWNDDYLHEWMDFKACVNAPGHQRLYMADIRIAPSNLEFYFIVSQGEGVQPAMAPEYGEETVEVSFQVFRHEEIFESAYNVKMKKLDDETGMPLKGSQFYLYERFDSKEMLGESEEDGSLSIENISFSPWDGFQIFAEGTTDSDGEIMYTDNRSYMYSKTYCDGHAVPEWAGGKSEESEEESEEAGEESADEEEVDSEGKKDANREAAAQWMELVEACESEASQSGGRHFHWLLDEDSFETVQRVLESGSGDQEMDEALAIDMDENDAFERSGCKADCEQTYENFTNLRFSYTWKEVQARHGYILHGVHPDDAPIEIISTNASEAGAESRLQEGNGQELQGNVWYSGNNDARRRTISEGGDGQEKTLRIEKEIHSSDIKIGKSQNKDGEIRSILRAEESGKYAKLFDDESMKETDSNVGMASGANARFVANSNTASESNAVTDSNAERTKPSEKRSPFSFLADWLSERSLDAEEGADDDAWESSEETGIFEEYLDSAEYDGMEHIDRGTADRYSFYRTENEERDYWMICDHRTEGEIHMNKRDMDLFKGESEEYCSYVDTEGDGILEGAVYGLFAAEDIVHPDSELLGNGSLTNTGIVYQKNDLVSVSETDAEGNASFMTYTVAPGMSYNYESRCVEKRDDIDWNGPVNLYTENQGIYGNWWMNRPLILGNYYVKELSRSEGYELSVNGKTQEWTNYGAGFDTPEEIADANGTAIVSMPELAASMEGEEESGTGYDELPFEITSVGTTGGVNGRNGYQIVAAGFPEGTLFYRVDSGEKEVTGPRVVGTEEVIMKDDTGNAIWKTAKSDVSNIKYVPVLDSEGVIIGQKPMIKTEMQKLQAAHIPAVRQMEIKEWSVDTSDSIWKTTVADADLGAENDAFCFLKAELEAFLYRNGYEVPTMADGTRSKREYPVYSMGVLKGEADLWGMTTTPMEPALKTVYGAAVKEMIFSAVDSETTIYELFASVLSWYCDHPQWSFGGIHSIEMEGEQCKVTLYAGEAAKTSRRFFTMKTVNGTMVADRVYAVYENPKTLRWVYQEYDAEGTYQYEIERQYSYGSGSEKRYYMDAVLTPAMMTDENGVLNPMEHSKMVYHEMGEEIIDYISGDSEHGYRVPETRIVDKVAVTAEMEWTEQDVLLENAEYDARTGTYTIQIQSEGVDSFGREFSDSADSLSLSFVAKLPVKKTILSAADIRGLGNANVHGYEESDEVGYAEYLLRFAGASISVVTGDVEGLEDTFIISKPLIYRGQHKVAEDGDTEKIPVQVLERPVKQKIKVLKVVEEEDAVRNFRFKLYLKSNLERLFCDENGEVVWLNQFGDPVDVFQYKSVFPELVQKLYTKKTERPVLETIKKTTVKSDGEREVLETYNYEKFFDAIWTANIDKWENERQTVQNTSWKPWSVSRLTGVENQINTSDEAKENAKRSDAVRQFAATWYLEKHIRQLTEQLPKHEYYQAKDGDVTYQDEIYDRALYMSILEAEEYLEVFFKYDLDRIYEICWDSETGGGIDRDPSTLTANQVEKDGETKEHAYGISPYLPYGEYVLTEQQPYRAEWFDFANRHYETDTPKELSLPFYYDEQEEKVYSSLVPWSVTEPGVKKEWSGYASPILVNRRYGVKLRVEKLDEETGEPILHSGAVFALYQAERNENADGDGTVRRYEKDTLIFGSKPFLQAMGATGINRFVRSRNTDGLTAEDLGVGALYSGWVPAGTPICKEKDCILFGDSKGLQTGAFAALSTVKDCVDLDLLQTTGFFETPEKIDAGVYVLAELAAPAGYVRTKPVAVEVYSDSTIYYPNGSEYGAASIRYGDWMLEDGILTDVGMETARVFVSNTATSLVISKTKTLDANRSMKVSGRVEGSVSALNMIYGLENLELAYNSAGTYLGFGWKKGTLEYLEQRKHAGERVELVYENGVFQGYGYVTKTLETSDDENRFVLGAAMALFEAIKVERTGDTKDHGFKGVEVTRDRNNNVESIVVKEGYAGESLKLEKSEEEIWSLKTQERTDTPVLFYDLGGLKVLERSKTGEVFGFDRSGKKIKVTFDTRSLFAMRNGRAEFEICGGDFSELSYDAREKAFTNMDTESVLYHLGEDGSRDAKVDGYTGLAYLDCHGSEDSQKEGQWMYVWPVYELTNSEGEVIKKEKILTGRPGEKYAGTEDAYITGTVRDGKDDLEKKMDPVYDRYGMVQYYPERAETYKKGEAQYDRDGEYMGYRYEALLNLYNQAAFGVLDPPALYDVGDPQDETDDVTVMHRSGEAWIIPNIWISGEQTPQDPAGDTTTYGCEDILRRVMPGTYILEELTAPNGYVRTLPTGVEVKETTQMQMASMTDERIKIEIAKVDGTDNYKKSIDSSEQREEEWSYEGKGSYTYRLIPGAKLALYKAKKVYTSDYHTYPNGYYLEKAENTPASWYLSESVSGEPMRVEAVWISSDVPKYFEGIPAGDYILEELETPKGYIPASMEITVREISELQSFMLMNDHTKLEIYKYEVGENNTKQRLAWPELAELSLYPARLDPEGNVVMEHGRYLHEEEPVAVWTTGGQLEYAKEMREEYEKMFQLYEDDFEMFSWNGIEDGKERIMSAKRKENHATENGETITQIWEMEDKTRMRVTVVTNDGMAREDADGGRKAVFEYQFHYVTAENGTESMMVSYDFANGIHRLDRIPVGQYVLVETKVPNGYEGAEPKLITVDATDAVQRYSVENRKLDLKPEGTLIIEKSDHDNPEEKLSGAWFEVKNLQNGDIFRIVTDENGQAVLKGLPVSGRYESGIFGPVIYEVRELYAPSGYQLNETIRQVRFRPDDGSEPVQYVHVENEKTKIQISKRDFESRYFVTGVKLAVYEAKLQNGKYTASKDALERWTSEDQPHTITGKLSGGHTYLLVEEEAPEGYVIAAPIRFVISSDGKRITEISENLTQISVSYNPKSNRVESISVVGLAARERNIQLKKGEESLLSISAKGNEVDWNQEIRILESEGKQGTGENLSNELLSLQEDIIFADGNSLCTEQVYFRREPGSRALSPDTGIYPVGTAYTFKTADGVVLDQWFIERGQEEHLLENETKSDGTLRFEAGEEYQLNEYVVFQDGSRIQTENISIRFDEEGNLTTVDMRNKESLVTVKKTDFTTGLELPGALLTIKDEQGAIIEEWVSGAEEYEIRGILSPGERYILEEKMAADGYSCAEEVSFVVDESGCVTKVIMEDRPTHVEIRKIDFVTGEELPGAELTLRDSSGKIVDQWISGESAHVIRGKLIAGEMYTLTEDTAPRGYDVAEFVTFTVSMDGRVDKVVMADHRKKQGVNLEDFEDTVKIEEKPHPDEIKKYGKITAMYQVHLGSEGELKIRVPDSFIISSIPKTGDVPFPWELIVGAALSLAGCIILLNKRGKDEKETKE